MCLITGGSRGGVLKDIALQFAAHGAAAVILMSRNSQRNQSAVDDINHQVNRIDNPICHSMPGDVSKLDDCKRVVSTAVQKFGKVDISGHQ